MGLFCQLEMQCHTQGPGSWSRNRNQPPALVSNLGLLGLSPAGRPWLSPGRAGFPPLLLPLLLFVEFLLFPLGHAGRAGKTHSKCTQKGKTKTKVRPGSMSQSWAWLQMMLLERRVRMEEFWIVGKQGQDGILEIHRADRAKPELLAAPGPPWSSANPSLLQEVSRRQGWAPGCSS